MPVYSMKAIDAEINQGVSPSTVMTITGLFTVPPNPEDMKKIIMIKSKKKTPKITRARIRYNIDLRSLNLDVANVSGLVPPKAVIGVIDCRGNMYRAREVNGKAVGFFLYYFEIRGEGEADITEAFNCVEQPFGLNAAYVEIVGSPTISAKMQGKIEVWVDLEVIGI